jgi:hypothetical protein
MLRAPVAALLAGILLFLSGFAGATGVARADEGGCENVDARLAFIRERLAADDHDSRRWMWAWTIAYGGLALGQAGLALTRDDEGEQVELYVGAAKSLLGLVPVLGLQNPALGNASKLEARVAEVSTGGATEAERCAVVAEAEKMLDASADDEAFNRGFLAHTGNVLVNGGGLLVIGIGEGRWVTGAIGTAVGIAVGELQIFTRPTASLRGRDGYRARWTVAPLVTGETTGVQVVGTF